MCIFVTTKDDLWEEILKVRLYTTTLLAKRIRTFLIYNTAIQNWKNE